MLEYFSKRAVILNSKSVVTFLSMIIIVISAFSNACLLWKIKSETSYF